MKKSFLKSLPYLFAALFALNASGQHFLQSTQSFKIFGQTFTAKEITGGKKFNDLGLAFYTSIINDLTDDSATYLWRLGSVRLNQSDYTKGAISLFDLSVANHDGGYPVLDSIDFLFYHDIGFNILEQKDNSLLKNKDYLNFKKAVNDKKKSLKEKREFLWDDSNFNFRNRLLASRYFENEQQISDEVTKKITHQFVLDSHVSLATLLKSYGVDTADASVKAYIKNTVDKHFHVNGYYISIVFQPRYIDIASNIIGELDTSVLIKKYPNDEFVKNLVSYVLSTRDALNSALFAFKLKGNFGDSVTNIDTAGLQASAKISINKVAPLSAAIKYQFDNQSTKTFKNNFSKVWIIQFGTDAILDSLKFKNSGTTKKPTH